MSAEPETESPVILRACDFFSPTVLEERRIDFACTRNHKPASSTRAWVAELSATPLNPRQKRNRVILSEMAARFCICVPFLGTRRHGVEESLSPLCMSDRNPFGKSIKSQALSRSGGTPFPFVPLCGTLRHGAKNLSRFERFLRAVVDAVSNAR
jgi:hypothetical protein